MENPDLSPALRHLHLLHSQRGGMLSLLAALLVLGLVAYFALRGYGGTHSGDTGNSAAAGAPQVACTQRITELMQRTGGLGPDYKTGYAALPHECQQMTPPPAALAGPKDADH